MIRDDAPFPFVVGVPRSGTTMLRLMLDAHPELAVPPESYFPVQLWGRRRRYRRAGGLDLSAFADDLLAHAWFPSWGVPQELVRSRFRGVEDISYPEAIRRVYGLYAEHRGKPRYGDKTPRFVRHVGMLAGLFPEARFVHIVRDGRDVALSWVGRSWGPDTLPQAAVQWGAWALAGRRDGRPLGPRRYLEVRYEDLVADPEAVVGRICSFVGVDFVPSMLEFHEDARDRLTGAERGNHPNIDRRLTQGLRDWRRDMPASDVAVFESLAGSALSAFGYPRAHPRLGSRGRIEAARHRLLLLKRRAPTLPRKAFVAVRRRVGLAPRGRAWG